MKTALKRSLRQIGERTIASLAAAPSLATLRIAPGQAGFFGEVFCALNGLRMAEKHGLAARINWGPRSQYFEPDYAQDGDVWGAFFVTSRFDFRQKAGTKGPLFSVTLKPGAHDFTPYEGMSIRRSVGLALRAWCQPQPNIAKAVDEAQAQLFAGRFMLGVHIRLTDAAAGFEDRQTVDLEQFFLAADSWLSEHPAAGIFLATDEGRIVAAFEARYGARVTFQDCLRSEDGTSIHGHYDAGVSGNPYQKGREVLIDALLLARCDYLIRTHSRVTAYSLCWSPELAFRDLELEITGVNRLPWLHEP
jgi:hypothetical protein